MRNELYRQQHERERTNIHMTGSPVRNAELQDLQVHSFGLQYQGKQNGNKITDGKGKEDEEDSDSTDDSDAADYGDSFR